MIEEKKIRSDKAKNISKVLKEVINNPLQSQRDIAESTWIWLWTVNRNLKELEQIGTKSEKILEICEVDFEIVKIWQKIINERLKDKTETDKMRTFEIAQTIEKSEKRYMLFQGSITDKNWWLKITDWSKLSDDELFDIAND